MKPVLVVSPLSAWGVFLLVSIVTIVTATPPATVLAGPFLVIRAPIVDVPVFSGSFIVPSTEVLVVIMWAVMALSLVALVVTLIVAHCEM